MKALSAKYPNDVDARVLAVEALMDLHPWVTCAHYWVTPLYLMAQFGMWDRILSYPKPDDDLAAQRVYREDLAVFPNNGWALLGLSQALRAQGKHAAAAQAKSNFDAAWSKADIELTASSFR
jgi:hypothetical protein